MAEKAIIATLILVYDTFIQIAATHVLVSKDFRHVDSVNMCSGGNFEGKQDDTIFSTHSVMYAAQRTKEKANSAFYI